MAIVSAVVLRDFVADDSAAQTTEQGAGDTAMRQASADHRAADSAGCGAGVSAIARRGRSFAR